MARPALPPRYRTASGPAAPAWQAGSRHHRAPTMIVLRPAAERGQARSGWLDRRRSFSFGSDHNPRHMGVSALRAINEDRIQPGAGFAAHDHRDLEIFSYVLAGCLEHRDSIGNHGRLQAGEVQLMSAGKGIRHSEYNPQSESTTHLLQIWIAPTMPDLPPCYAQRDFSTVQGLHPIVSPDGAGASLTIRQDARIELARLAEQAVSRAADPTRQYYLHVARGMLKLNGIPLRGGDGATLAGETNIHLQADGETEALLFDLP